MRPAWLGALAFSLELLVAPPSWGTNGQPRECLLTLRQFADRHALQDVLDDPAVAAEFSRAIDLRAEKMLGRAPSRPASAPEQMFPGRHKRLSREFLDLHDPIDLAETVPRGFAELWGLSLGELDRKFGPRLRTVSVREFSALYHAELNRRFDALLAVSPKATGPWHRQATGLDEAPDGVFVAVHPGPGTLSKEIKKYLQSHPDLKKVPRLALVNENNPITDVELLQELSAVSYSYTGETHGLRTNLFHFAGGQMGACMHEALLGLTASTLANPAYKDMTAVIHTPVVVDSSYLSDELTVAGALRACGPDNYRPALERAAKTALQPEFAGKTFDLAGASYGRMVGSDGNVRFTVDVKHRPSGKTLHLVFQ